MAGRRSPVTDIREILRRLQLGEPKRILNGAFAFLNRPLFLIAKELEPSDLHRHPVDNVLTRLSDVQRLALRAAKRHIGVERASPLREFDQADDLSLWRENYHFP